MTSRRLRALLVLVLAVSAVAVAGAGLDADAGGGGSPGAGGGDGFFVGDGEGGLFPSSDLEDGPRTGSSAILRALLSAVFAVVTVATVLVVALVVARHGLRGVVAVVAAVLATLVTGAVLATGLLVLMEAVQDLLGAAGGGGLAGGSDSGAGGEGPGTALDLPLPAVLLVGALALLVGGLALRFRGGRTDGDEPATAGPGAGRPEPEPAPGAGGRPRSAAGPDGVAADNEVYRAWLALADAAGASPTAASPGTVARRAVEAGVDESVAREITELFEEVRYGGAAPTPERERRAADARERLGGASP